MIRRVVIALTLVALALSMVTLTGCRKNKGVPPPMSGMGAGAIDTNRPLGDTSMAGAQYTHGP